MSRLADTMTFLPITSTFVDSYDDFFEGVSAAGVVYTDVVNIAKYRKVIYVLQKAGGASGTTTITVESCDDVTPSTSTAIGFWYKASTTLDVYSDWTYVASTGLATTAGANQCYVIEVDASEMSSTDNYVRMVCTELVDAAVEGALLTILGQPRNMLENPITAIT